ncbi:MAG: hypothetical protein QM647_03630 [Asticcacaulis sp.]|uniref:hypothetical protein n=1 Tax=Asticcacaulis sp. TaxID=1872648 RepID=UPI0039E46388
MMTASKARLLTIAALGTALLGASLLSACGKLGDLDRAPPMMNKKAKAQWSTSQNSDGGVTTTTDSSTSRASEKALPDADGQNSVENPYTVNKSIQDAPLEGNGSNNGFNNPPSH